MWQWMSDNSQVLSMFANVGLLIVWLLYLQLFLYGYRRQRRCKILINISGQARPQAHCVIANMSAEPVYVMAVVAQLTTDEETWSRSITNYELADDADPPSDPMSLSRQGPLRTGEYRDLGSFADLISRARHAHGDREAPDRLSDGHRPAELTLTVIATYDAEDLLVGAWRCFALPAEAGGEEVRPKTTETQQIRSRRERRRLKQHLETFE